MSGSGSNWPWERMVADYIAGMTDAYAEKCTPNFTPAVPGRSMNAISVSGGEAA